jgi:hypothetical protein
LQTSSKYSDPEPSDDFISLSTDDEDDDDDEDVTSDADQELEENRCDRLIITIADVTK